jgi:hypothetical protein
MILVQLTTVKIPLSVSCGQLRPSRATGQLPSLNVTPELTIMEKYPSFDQLHKTTDMSPQVFATVADERGATGPLRR